MVKWYNGKTGGGVSRAGRAGGLGAVIILWRGGKSGAGVDRWRKRIATLTLSIRTRLPLEGVCEEGGASEERAR